MLQQASVEGPPSARLQAALSWASIATGWSHSSSTDAYRTAFELLEVILANTRSLELRYLRLTSASIRRTKNLAADAAACAIRFDDIETALEILEQGRSLLFTQVGRYRTQVDDLEAVQPTLAYEFKTISTKMEASSMNIGRQDGNLATGQVEDVVAAYVLFVYSM